MQYEDLTTYETAQYLGLPIDALKQQSTLSQLGLVRHSRTDGTYFFKRSELEAWARANRLPLVRVAGAEY